MLRFAVLFAAVSIFDTRVAGVWPTQPPVQAAPPAARHDQSMICPFAFTIDHSFVWKGSWRAGYQLVFRINSVEEVPGSERYWFVRFKTNIAHNSIDAYATGTGPIDPRPNYPATRPVKVGHFVIPRLNLLPGQSFAIRLHFNGVVEQFALVYDSNKGLILSEVQSEYWHAENRPFQIDGFSQVVVKQRGITYAASNVSIAALTDDEIRWIVEMPFFQTRPIDIRIVDDVLFVETSNGHTYSVKKADGEWVFHHTEELVGHSLVDEIIQLAIDEVAKSNDGHYRLHKHIAALAALEDECAAPLLIECVDKGGGYPEKAMAVAALQRILGDKAGWHDPFTPGIAEHYRPITRRLLRKGGRDREVAWWESVYGVSVQDLLPKDYTPDPPSLRD